MRKLLLMAVVAIMAVSCCSTSTESLETTTEMKEQFVKKYTNADFYKEGVFQADVAKKAFLELFEYYDYPMTPFLEANIWFADFGLGDFENCGMGGVFWVNDVESGYFAHDIYLLPGQMIPEHKHVETEHPAKMESWMVLKGMCYNFSEVCGSESGAPVIAESQQATNVSKKFVEQGVGDIVHLAAAGVGTWHFLMGGPNGAIVTEWANYHDGSGLRFTHPNAKM